MAKKIEKTHRILKNNVAVFCIGLLIGAFIGGGGAFAVLSYSYADEVEAPKVADLQVAINTLTDEDMQILGQYMDSDCIAATNELLGGQSVNAQAFMATYVTIDTDFAENILLDYLGLE